MTSIPIKLSIKLAEPKIEPKNKEEKPMVPKGNLIKDYDGTLVLRPGRWNQMETKVMPLHNLIHKEMLGWVRTNIYWILIWDNEKYFKVPFARNKLWFMALTSEPEFIAIRELDQIYLA